MIFDFDILYQNLFSARQRPRLLFVCKIIQVETQIFYKRYTGVESSENTGSCREEDQRSLQREKFYIYLIFLIKYLSCQNIGIKRIVSITQHRTFLYVMGWTFHWRSSSTVDYLVYWNRKLIRESNDNQVFAIWRMYTGIRLYMVF